MNKAQVFTSHLTLIMSLMFAVFLIPDQFNTMMNFAGNGISRCLLATLRASGIIQSECSPAWNGRKG